MLYDILSPLIFFISLGGIILIVGRVVIRMRRSELQTNIKSSVAAGPSPVSTMWQPGSRDVAQLLKPTQKSVHALRSRFGLLLHAVSQTRTGIRAWRVARAEQKARQQAEKEKAAAQTTAVSPVAPAVPSREATGIVVQPTPSQLSRLKFWQRSTTPESIVKAAPTLVSSQPQREVNRRRTSPNVSIPSGTVVTSQAMTSLPKPVAVAPTPKAQALVSKPAEAPITATAATDRHFARSLLRRVQGKQHPAPAMLQAAAEQLHEQHFQAAEDMLIPYIVKHPKDTAAYMLLGQAALGREAWEEAMEIFEQIIKWNRKQAGAYAGLGQAAYRAGRFTRAIEALQRAHDADPLNRLVLEQLLSIAKKMDNPALQHSIRTKLETLATPTGTAATKKHAPSERIGVEK